MSRTAARMRPDAVSRFGPEDRHWMARALVVGARGCGRTAPNPPVGAVIVRDGRMLGCGWHEQAGQPHAEVSAVQNAATDLTGATLYVTLEPCSTEGRTPPCTALVIRERFSRVVVSALDANPRHAGRGIDILRAAGLRVDVGLFEKQGHRLVAGFESLQRRKRPRLTVKLGCSLDGRIADKSGGSQWITGSLARYRVQKMRLQSDAVIVGIGTALADNPSLRSRLPGAAGRHRLIVDPRGQLPLDSNVLTDGFVGETVLAVSKELPQEVLRPLEDSGASCWRIPLHECGGLDLSTLFQRMGEQGWLDVLCEGGAGLVGALYDADLIDEWVVFMAPLVMGGEALPFAGGNGTVLDKVRRGSFDEIRRVGDDVMLRMSEG